jgi:hypothetical protein
MRVFGRRDFHLERHLDAVHLAVIRKIHLSGKTADGCGCKVFHAEQQAG